MSETRSVTRLLRDWRAGDEAARDELMPLVYEELHQLAARQLRHERPGATWRPTDLVSEAFLRLAGNAQPEWNDRLHFFAFSARIMRQLLVDRARRRLADKRGGRARHVTIDEAIASPDRPDDLVALDEALAELGQLDERKAAAIELHYFGGLGQADIARLWSVHVNTVARDLRLATAWLHVWMQREHGGGAS
ncbi:MAG: ECF-type sigma factor [Myxococcota bacterium]